MPKPICVKCKRFFKPHRNGVFALEQMPNGNDVRPGTDDEDRWRPYKIWQADLYRCDGCGDEIVTGFGHNRLVEHYEPDFERFLPLVTHTVNDC